MEFRRVPYKQISTKLSYRNAPDFCLIFEQSGSKVELYPERRGGITHVE